MAEFKIQAGARINLLTREELRQEMDAARTNWVHEVARGIRYRRFSTFATSDGAGAIEIGIQGDQRMGPGEGFVWQLGRLSVSAYDPSGGDALALYQGSVSDSAIIIPALDTFNDMLTEVLYPGDTLVVAGTVSASTQVWVTGQVKEAPVSLLWRL